MLRGFYNTLSTIILRMIIFNQQKFMLVIFNLLVLVLTICSFLRWCHGSPVHRYGLYALQWIVEVNGKATPDLDAFVNVTKVSLVASFFPLCILCFIHKSLVIWLYGVLLEVKIFSFSSSRFRFWMFNGYFEAYLVFNYTTANSLFHSISLNGLPKILT